ncbi:MULTISPECIES: YihY family inner membrane protein [Bacillus]|uniref:Ribonuclease n=1 Tax=Bacillus amyloliquefaciens TaxID=1390 RepID=A0AAP7T9Z0_BACAM|nr:MULTISPECIES: YihY family inner membrane protein [Bacillus amyloliquefaciens group]AIW32794.1 ribonuclease [Bacillus subtilis]AEB22905.1 integral inner membrane protein with ribonuclease fold [Bacillus amyloliquefaciens TA208]AEB62360.1 putative integral inner membrane protein with ribonuclease fold [Bacillus amyloliquefaciens LL3]AEK87906.1 putative integral inner membrane protein with ribonuclease fold [Bacillus amyloliquefaciens XH7]ASF28055.1 ribonuclease [Bacillus amyloliquefaciens]
MSFMKELFARFSLHEGQSKSAELAYFFLLSLFPLIIFILTLTAYLPISAEDVLGAVDQYAPDSAMSMVKSITEQTLNKRSGGLLSFGIIAVIWSASNGMNAIVRAFNHAYEVEENRSFIIIRLTSIFLTIAMVVTILIALLLPVFGREIGLLAADFIGAPGLFLQVWSVVRWGISPLILLIVFTALYIFAPNKRLSLRFVLPGAVFAAAGWIIVSMLFSFYVGTFANYSATYGSIGGIIVLMIWFYLTGTLLILGGEINALLHKRKKLPDENPYRGSKL